MKTVRGRVLLAVGILAVIALSLSLHHLNTEGTQREAPPRRSIVQETALPDEVLRQISLETNRPTRLHSDTKRLADMTAEEKAKLAKNFKEKYQPVVAKWFKAYENRIPFQFEDFMLEKFHSCLGDYMYTFMIGDTTFAIQDSPKLGLKVSYLMTHQGAYELNKIPGDGFVPNLNIPVTREEIIRMVKADSGVEFKLNEIILNPTAAACALNGGAFVSVLPTGADPNNALNNKISMVFGPDGKLVSYTRDPFF